MGNIFRIDRVEILEKPKTKVLDDGSSLTVYAEKPSQPEDEAFAGINTSLDGYFIPDDFTGIAGPRRNGALISIIVWGNQIGERVVTRGRQPQSIYEWRIRRAENFARKVLMGHLGDKP